MTGAFVATAFFDAVFFEAVFFEAVLAAFFTGLAAAFFAGFFFVGINSSQICFSPPGGSIYIRQNAEKMEEIFGA